MAKTAKAGILVVDDHVVVGEALAGLINRQKDLLCCGRIESSTAVMPAVAKHKPDLVLLDLLLKNKDATGMIFSLVARFTGLRVLVLSQLDEFSHAERVLNAGARGYVAKHETTNVILAAIRTVLKGEIYLSRKMAARLLHKFAEEKTFDAKSSAHSRASISRREAQVLQMIGSGKKAGEIADELNLSVKTIQTHRDNIKRKLGLRTAPELIHYAIEWVESRVPQSLLFKK